MPQSPMTIEEKLKKIVPTVGDEFCQGHFNDLLKLVEEEVKLAEEAERERTFEEVREEARRTLAKIDSDRIENLISALPK